MIELINSFDFFRRVFPTAAGIRVRADTTLRMATRGPRQVGAPSWITDERASALQITQSEIEEFTFSAKNDVDWLNEHMAEIFGENQMCAGSHRKHEGAVLTKYTRNITDVFKTPGKLRGRTPRTARKANVGEIRVV